VVNASGQLRTRNLQRFGTVAAPSIER
jgi:hypothetical protein